MFNGLRLNHLSNVGIASMRLNGKSVAMIVALDKQPNEDVIIPIAVLCDKKFLAAFGDNIHGPDGNKLPK